jgi:hypothetical protein
MKGRRQLTFQTRNPLFAETVTATLIHTHLTWLLGEAEWDLTTQHNKNSLVWDNLREIIFSLSLSLDIGYVVGKNGHQNVLQGTAFYCPFSFFDEMQMNEYITYCASRNNGVIKQIINFYSPIKHHSFTMWLSEIKRTMRSNVNVKKKGCSDWKIYKKMWCNIYV